MTMAWTSEMFTAKDRRYHLVRYRDEVSENWRRILPSEARRMIAPGFAASLDSQPEEEMAEFLTREEAEAEFHKPEHEPSVKKYARGAALVHVAFGSIPVALMPAAIA